MAKLFRKIEAQKYEYAGTGYVVEKMANGLWDAYLPSEWGTRIWQSPAHKTRVSAAAAISAERRTVRLQLAAALEK